MVREQLLSALRKHRGDVFVEVANFHDYIWVKCSKTDLMEQIGKFKAGSETGFTLDADGSLTKDYENEN